MVRKFWVRGGFVILTHIVSNLWCRLSFPCKLLFSILASFVTLAGFQVTLKMASSNKGSTTFLAFYYKDIGLSRKKTFKWSQFGRCLSGQILTLWPDYDLVAKL